MSQNNQQKHIFDDDQITSLGGFLDSIKQVHVRLINEGYIIKDGKIIPPKNKTYEKQKI